MLDEQSGKTYGKGIDYDVENETDAPDVLTPEAAEKRADISALKTKLVLARKYAAQAEFAYGEKYKELIEVLEATRKSWEVLNASVVAEHERTKDYLERVEKDLRQQLVDWSKETGEKRFDDHLSTRCIVKLDYELDDATGWAKTNAPFILVADKKQFEQIAKKQELEFVTKMPTYSAVIASELPDPAGEVLPADQDASTL